MGVIYATESESFDVDTEEVQTNPALLSKNRNIVETIKPFFESILLNNAYDPAMIRIVSNRIVYFPGDESHPERGKETKTSGLVREIFLGKPEVVIAVAEGLDINLDNSVYMYKKFRDSNPEQ